MNEHEWGDMSDSAIGRLATAMVLADPERACARSEPLFLDVLYELLGDRSAARLHFQLLSDPERYPPGQLSLEKEAARSLQDFGVEATSPHLLARCVASRTLFEQLLRTFASEEFGDDATVTAYLEYVLGKSTAEAEGGSQRVGGVARKRGWVANLLGPAIEVFDPQPAALAPVLLDASEEGSGTPSRIRRWKVPFAERTLAEAKGAVEWWDGTLMIVATPVREDVVRWRLECGVRSDAFADAASRVRVTVSAGDDAVSVELGPDRPSAYLPWNLTVEDSPDRYGWSVVAS